MYLLILCESRVAHLIRFLVLKLTYQFCLQTDIPNWLPKAAMPLASIILPVQKLNISRVNRASTFENVISRGGCLRRYVFENGIEETKKDSQIPLVTNLSIAVSLSSSRPEHLE